MGFHPHRNHTILLWPCHAHQDIAGPTLPPVERGCFRLVDLARNQLPGAGDAAAVFAGNRELDARREAGIVDWLVFAHLESNPTPVLQSHPVFLHHGIQERPHVFRYDNSNPGSPHNKSGNSCWRRREKTFRLNSALGHVW